MNLRLNKIEIILLLSILKQAKISLYRKYSDKTVLPGAKSVYLNETFLGLINEMEVMEQKIENLLERYE